MISRRNFLALLSAARILSDLWTSKESSEKVWVQFATGLADTLADLGQGEFLIISIRKNWHYVQFAGQGKFGTRVEARSNAYTGTNDKLSEQACAKLLSLGWRAPTYLPDQLHPERNERDGSPNYFVDMGVRVPYSSIARLAVDTLRGPFGVAHPGELQYRAFSNADGKIRFPNLHIPCKL